MLDCHLINQLKEFIFSGKLYCFINCTQNEYILYYIVQSMTGRRQQLKKQACDFTWKAAERAGPYPKVVWMFFTRAGLL